MANSYSVNDHFVNKDPSVRALYDELMKMLNKVGSVKEDPKKTSIHINRNSALLGVETRKDCLLLNIKSARKVNSPRIEKTEQISAKRFHFRVRISSPNDLDDELKGWLREAYLLSE